MHDRIELFREPNTDPEELSGSLISEAAAAEASRKHLFDSLESERPRAILVTLSIYNLALYTRKLLGEIKEAFPDALLVTGGIYSTLHPEEILADGNVDVVIRGEGEFTSAVLLERLESGGDLAGVAGLSYRENNTVVHNRARAPVADLDELPHPYTVSGEFKIPRRFELLSELLPHGDWIPGAGFLTSRGCPEACSFCLDPAINNMRTRFHTPEYVREVLDYCSENFQGGAGSFFFGDATFTMNRKRLRKMLGLLDGLPYTYQIQTRADYLDRDIVGALAARGFTNVAIGAESFNEEILRDVARKRLDVGSILEAARAVMAAGMYPMLTFITGLPGETRESVWRTVDILRENGLRTATFFPLVVFKGTALFERFAERVPPGDRESFRLNPWSEEYLCASDEFPTAAELTSFTEEVNRTFVASNL